MLRNKSFTLIEVTIAVFLITMGALGAYALIQRIITFSSVSSSQLVATYLAQEGIEIVRNIRDNNWLEQRNDAESPILPVWNDGLSVSSWEADYNDLSLTAADRFLNIDGSNFYGYSAGTASKFKRKIIILQSDAEKLVVSVEVTWSERGGQHRVKAETELYNWK